MPLADHLTPELIHFDLKPKDKWDLIDKMVDILMTNPDIANHPTWTREAVHAAILEREKENSTGIGEGCAIPHARLSNFQGTAVCLVVLRNPIDFDAIDGQPIQVACMLVVPEDKPTIPLRIMAELASLLLSQPSRYFFLRVDDKEVLLEYLRERRDTQDMTIVARDIMHKAFADIYPDTPLTEVTRIMQHHHLDAVAVIERDGTLVGEITCDALFKSGMPDFFNQLRSVSFIRMFDPFEKYFKEEKNTTARDIMKKNYAALNEDATLIEVIFLLAVKKHLKVYVLREGKRVGVIDRISVLDRVINF